MTLILVLGLYTHREEDKKKKVVALKSVQQTLCDIPTASRGTCLSDPVAYLGFCGQPLRTVHQSNNEMYTGKIR